MKFTDLILSRSLSSKKSVSDVMDFCAKDEEFCKKPRNKEMITREMIKLSGYKTKKDFNYSSLFKEMAKISLNHVSRHKDSESLADLSTENLANNILKLTPPFKRALAAKGSPRVYDFLLYNGVDLRKESDMGGNFKYDEPLSPFQEP